MKYSTPLLASILLGSLLAPSAWSEPANATQVGEQPFGNQIDFRYKGPDAGAPIALVIDAPLATPVEQAIVELERVLRGRGFWPIRRSGDKPFTPALIIGIAGASPTVDKLLSALKAKLPNTPESLCTVEASDKSKILAGSDSRGLSYAILEAARAIELAPKGVDPLEAIPHAVESPYLRTRSMTVHLFNADLEKEWYFDEAYWKSYFTLLARSRYNNFTLTFADQTNYLCPPYAYLVDLPTYPQVRVNGLSAEQRRRNLEMLRRIGELAHERAIDFTLGIWTQLPVPKYAGEIKVTGLPEGAAAAGYCEAGLKRILEECPAIDAVQFRMNVEAGVAEDQQAGFYQPLFEAIRDCGRPVRVDLRYKGLRPETLKQSIDLKLDTTVSTKFWCEHLGLPYHPTVADSHYRESRYSFGNMLTHPRDYRVVYQLWSVGSQRLLLWGDPDYAARFAKSCTLGGGEGFEVFAPLTNKGFGDKPGNWRIFADKSYEHYQWEFERYWYFYLVFGRMGYDPYTFDDVWMRELRHRFGAAAEEVESAYHEASQIMPLITATHQLSAGEWAYWPEMDNGDRLPEYMHVQPSDTTQFYAIRSWKRTPLWRTEEWDANIPGYVEDAVKGTLSAKWTPIQVSRRLRELAERTLASLDKAQATLGDSVSGEFRATELDLRVLAHLGLYHSEKKLAATELGFLEAAKRFDRSLKTLEHIQAAAAHWQKVVDLTDGVYAPNLVFGPSPEQGRRGGHYETGHWKDRLAEVREDVEYVKHSWQIGRSRESRVFPGETPPKELPVIQHKPIETADPAADLEIASTVTSGSPVLKVLLHYRPLDQTADWKQVAMERTGETYRATISSKAILSRFDFQYYLEAWCNGGGSLWPSWEKGPPYVVVKVKRPERP